MRKIIISFLSNVLAFLTSIAILFLLGNYLLSKSGNSTTSNWKHLTDVSISFSRNGSNLNAYFGNEIVYHPESEERMGEYIQTDISPYNQEFSIQFNRKASNFNSIINSVCGETPVFSELMPNFY